MAAAATLVLLLPYSLSVKDAFTDPAAFGIAFDPHLTLSDVLRFHTGPSGGGIASWGIFATAAFALFVAAGPRLAWTARAWMLAATGFAMVYLPERLASDHAVAAPEGPLTLAALGLALAAGIGIGVFADELQRARFGWRQVAAIAAGAGVVLAGVGFAADAVDGRWHAPSDDWQRQLAFTADQQYQGTFRILWLGRADILPLDPFDYDGQLSYVVTRNGPGDVRELLRAPEGKADAVVRDAIGLTTGRRTNRLGRLLAPMGVRYVAVPSTTGPGGQRDAPPPGLTASLAEQLDLARLHTPPGLVLYENEAWIPERAQITGPAASRVPTGPVDPSRSALRTDLSGSAVPLGDAPVPPGTALLGQANDSDWKATAGGRTLTHEQAFGWSNAFPVPTQSAVSLQFDGQSTHNLLLVAAAVPWLVLLALWWFGRRRDRARRRATAAARRAERLAAPAPAGRTGLQRRARARRGLLEPRVSPRVARRTFRLPIILVVGALVAGAIYLDQTAPEASGARAQAAAAAAAAAAATIQGPTIPRADSLSTAWYCAEGTSSANGRADETVVIGNLSTATVGATVTVMPGGSQAPVSKRLQVGGFGQARVHIADVLATVEPGVIVEVFGGPAVVEHELTGNGDVAVGPCARDAAPDWYFAAGATARDAQEFLALFNPYGDDAIVDVTFLTDAGVQAPEAFQGLVVPRRSRVTLAVADEVRRQDHVAAFVHAAYRPRRRRAHPAVRRIRGQGRDRRVARSDCAGQAVDAAVRRRAGGRRAGGRGRELRVVAGGRRGRRPRRGHRRGDTPERAGGGPVHHAGRRRQQGTGGDQLHRGGEGGTRHAGRRGDLVRGDGTGGGKGIATAIGATAPARTWAFALGRTENESDARVIAYNPGPKPVTVELRAYTAGDPNSPRERAGRRHPGRRPGRVRPRCPGCPARAGVRARSGRADRRRTRDHRRGRVPLDGHPVRVLTWSRASSSASCCSPSCW